MRLNKFKIIAYKIIVQVGKNLMMNNYKYYLEDYLNR